MTQVDPQLNYAAEVVLDVDGPLLRPLEVLQHTFIRRLLGLSARSVVVVLFTETGLEPLRYRRAWMALSYLSYLLLERPQLPFQALKSALELAAIGKPCWITDLRLALAMLPYPVLRGFTSATTREDVDQCITAVEESLTTYIQNTVAQSDRLVLLKGRKEWCPRTKSMTCTPFTFREYLKIPTHEHRIALARLLASDHPLAIQQLRQGALARQREHRTCRFCAIEGCVESEAHVLIDCEDDRVVALREPFMSRAYTEVPAVISMRREMDSTEFLKSLLSRWRIMELLAEYVFDVFELCRTVPLNV